MARYNEILVGRYNRLLQKLLSMKGGPPAPQLASEIVPGIVLFNGVENRYLEEWKEFGFGQTAAGAAGFPSIVQLRNPAGSNVIAAIEMMVLSTTAADSITITMGTFASDLTLTAAPAIIDTRGGTIGVTSSTLKLSTSNATAGGGLARVFFFQTQASVPIELITFDNQEWPLNPGTTIRIETIAANNALTFGLRWRERFLEESERT